MAIKYPNKVPISEEQRIEATDEFIEKNHLTLTRTEEDLLKQIEQDDSAFGFETEIIIPYLSWESRARFYKEEYQEKVRAGEETPDPIITDLKEAVQEFLDYMVFAWGKAEDQRGLSASRSIDKLSAWLWLLGREDLKELITDRDLYNPYGSPALIAVCDKLEIDVPESLREFSKHKCRI